MTWTVAGRLFQARVWREYAMAWDEKVLRTSKAECLRRSRVNAYRARRLNRKGIR